MSFPIPNCLKKHATKSALAYLADPLSDRYGCKVMIDCIYKEYKRRLPMKKYAVVNSLPEPYVKNFTKFHDTLEIAKEEAARLCRKEGVSFFVLELVGRCDVENTPVKWTEL